MLTLIALSLALAQTPPAPPEPEVRTHVFVHGGPDGRGLDRDGDGQVTRDEFSAPLNDAFERLDKDGDGRLSAEELASDRGPGPHRFEFRTSGDEAGPGGRRELVVVTRGDGDGPEPIVIRQGGAGEPFTISGRIEPGDIELHRLGGPGGSDDLDKDGDGKVSEAEFTAPLRDAFARMDADHSGFIEQGEHGEDGDVHVVTRRIERHVD